MKLDDLLSQTYHAELRGQRLEAIDRLKAYIKEDPLLLAAAQAKIILLDELISVRGDMACAFSTRYCKYLHEVLG